MKAFNYQDELVDSKKIAKEYYDIIKSQKIKTVAFVAKFKTSLEVEKSTDTDRIAILNPIKLNASFCLYKSLIDYDKDNELNFMDQFLFFDFIKKISSISYDKIYSRNQETMDFLNSSGIDGLITFTVAGDHSFIVELVLTSNNSSFNTRKVLMIDKNKNNALLEAYEEYSEEVEDLTSRLYFDLQTLDMFH
ncbi:MAG: hypothetical protein Q3M24_05895 [Candidatus Electrothrix aestuarii]|uniref:Uncharacterized protein n=1 Tax=Candidatus Electrothrix aestuarii TaxID=3062594 RepID=A0AAU8LYU5_9BACT|nr:hypothetical protein [Candidatus Electrothrix aestuarii]